MAAPDRVRVLQRHVRIGDPHVCSDDRARLSLLRSIYEPLVRRGASGSHLPALAAAWSVSDDAREWSFHLRDGAHFHDGAALEVDDVIASLSRIRDDPPAGELGTSGVYQSYLAGSTIEARSAGEVRISLPEPMADLLDILGELAILRAPQVAASEALPVGSGPFRLVERDDERVVLERFAAYHGGAAPVARALFETHAEADGRLAAIEQGAADIAVDVPPTAADPSVCRFRPDSTTTTFMANLESGPLTDPRVRRALNHAVDVDALISELFGGHADRVASPCTIPQLGYDPDLEPYRHDPERARKLLVEAGAERIRLCFDIPEVLPDEAPALAAAVAEQFDAVGVTLEVRRHTDRPGYAERVRDGRIADAACFDSSPSSTFRLFREKFHSGVRGVWWLGYRNPEFDEQVDRAARTADLPARQQHYRRAAALLHHDAPWLYLYASRLCWAVAPAMAGWNPTADGLVDLSARGFENGRAD